MKFKLIDTLHFGRLAKLHLRLAIVTIGNG
jgi:hypothetical protein